METFASQTPIFLVALSQRKRRPGKPSTVALWTSLAHNWIIPRIGPLSLEGFGNKQMKEFADALCDEDPPLSPRTIREIIRLCKAIVASPVDPETGDRLYSRDWNNGFIDLPRVDNHKPPIIDARTIERLVCERKPRYAALYCLLAASGFRLANQRSSCD